MGFHEIERKISIQSALQLIYSNTSRLGGEEVEVTASLGRIVGSEIRSSIDVPHFDR